MFTFDEDDLVDCIAGALLMAIGTDPGSALGEMHPMDWVPIAKDVAEDIRDWFPNLKDKFIVEENSAKV
jgi:hypothetical protein